MGWIPIERDIQNHIFIDYFQGGNKSLQNQNMYLHFHLIHN